MILDVGCGTELRGDVGIDLFEGKCFEDIKKLKQFKKHENFVKGDALNLPFRSGIFEKTVSFQLIEHIDNPVKLIKEMARVGKKIMVVTPNATWIGKVFRSLRSGKYKPYSGHIFTWGVPEFENLFRYCGIKDTKVIYFEGDPKFHNKYWIYNIIEKFVPNILKYISIGIEGSSYIY